MFRTIAYTLLSLVILSSSCLIKPPEELADMWDEVYSDELITPVRNMYSGVVELYVISDDEFLRINSQNEIVERRLLTLPFRFFGRPSLSENVFARVLRQGQTGQDIEFHLTRKADEIYVVDLDDIQTQLGEVMEAESSARYTSAFNADGTQFMLPVRNLTKSIYTFLLFDVNINSNNSKIESVTLNKAIDAADMPNDNESMQNFTFIDGNYYVATLNGGFRINPNGQVTRFDRNWIFEIFKYKDKLYYVSTNGGLYESEDNGIQWERITDEDKPTEIRFVEVANDQVLTHRFLGGPFKLADDDLEDVGVMRLNKDFRDDLGAYFCIRYFFGRYYLSNQKLIYVSDEIETVE